MRAKRRRFIPVFLLLLCLLSAACAEGTPKIELHVGYGDAVLCGRYQPLYIRIEAGDEAIDGMAAIDLHARSGMKDRIEIDVQADEGEAAEMTIPILTLVPQMEFSLTLRHEEQILASASYRAAQSIERNAMIIGLLGCMDEAAAAALTTDETEDPLKRMETIHAIPLDPDVIGRSERELSAFDVMMLSGDCPLSDTQKAALTEWLLDGGILIAGKGKGGNDTLHWAAQLADVGLIKDDSSEPDAQGVIHALMCYTDTAYQTDGLDDAAEFRLEAKDADALISVDDGAIAAACRKGRGLLVITGFDWDTTAMRQANEKQAILRRMLLTIDSERYRQIVEESSTPNYTIATAAARMQRVDEGKSILPFVILLSGYALVSGVGLYALLRSRDRTKLIWAILPALAVAMCGAAVLHGIGLGFGQPAASSLRVTQYGIDGGGDVQEIVHLGYMGQERAVISAGTGERIERLSYGYASSYFSKEDELELRDVMREGNAPSLELPSAASWTTRDLVIVKEDKPQGIIEAQAQLTRDGLRAEIRNGTPMQLEDAILMTSLGYARVGSLAPGQEAAVHISRPGEWKFDQDANPVITEGEILPYTTNVYTIAHAYAYPEEQTEGESIQYSDQEQYERSLAAELVRSGAESHSDTFFCMLAAREKDAQRTPLLIDGEEIDRCAHTGMVFADMPCSLAGDDGYVYIPREATPVLSVSMDENDVLTSGQEMKNGYVSAEKEAVFAYRPEGILDMDVARLAFSTDSWIEREELTAAVYDHEAGAWIAIDGLSYAEADGELARRAVSAEGEVFVRYMGQMESGVYAPRITVEGVRTK